MNSKLGTRNSELIPMDTPNVTGTTRVVGVMAWPVTHTLSPPMHNAVYAGSGMNLIYVPFPVRPDRMGEAVRGIRALGMLGMNVTIPHKPAVIEFLDEISLEARVCHSVNTIHVTDDGRLIGHSTDGFGFLKTLEVDGGYDPKGKRAVMVGTGGAGHAMAVALALRGAQSIMLLNRTESKRVELCATLQGLKEAPKGFEVAHADPHSPEARAATVEADLIVNATSLGMKPGDALPLDPEWLRAGQFVYDTIYIPAETRLLQEARKRGCRFLSGLGMLAYQGARSIEIWTGQWPDAALMKRVLARNLGLE
ncbi:MAG: shikimate dehydrogenase [Candidatus Sumerlaeota bacterium]|nr:shikimate dehydrogenase [Candidatus Sumerlaeota bacterium]